MRMTMDAKLLRFALGIACFVVATTFVSAAPAPDAPATGMSQAAHLQSDAAALEPKPTSARVAAAIERLRLQPAPAGEAFALIKVTDRTTGERVMLTRGVPPPNFDAYLVDPATAPAGWIFAEESALGAEDGVEIAIRSHSMVPSKIAAEEAGPVLSEDDEEYLRLARQYDGGPLPLRIDSDLRKALGVRSALDGADGEPIHVAIELRNVAHVRIPKAPDLEAGGHLWAALEIQAQRERVIGERKLAIRSRQMPVEQAVRAAGGLVLYSSWLSGTVEAMLTPAAIVALAGHPAVRSIEKVLENTASGASLGGTPTKDYFDGIDIFDSTHQSAFDNHEGYHSAGGHSYTSRVTIGMVEECIREDSPAWRNNNPSSSFRARFYDIDPLGHTLGSVENCWADGDGEKFEHGHWVASMMVADFMDGQEPALSTNSRRRLTGSCPECYLTFFQDQNLNQRIEGLDRACEKGVDIFQSSVGTNAQSCDGNGGFDGTLQDLTLDCGALFVQSAGNNGSGSGSCTTAYPADHPWTLTVGGVRTDIPCSDDSDWFTSNCVYDSGASRGGATYNGDSNRASVIDLAAPYRVITLDPDVLTPATQIRIQGTSFSSPIVAGLAGRMMDFWRQHADTSVFYSNRMKTMMLLFGDRSTGQTGAIRTDDDTSKLWGVGRVTLFPFDESDGWWLRRGSVYLKKKEDYAFDQALPSGAKMVKVVVWHDGKDYATEPKIKLEVDPGGGCSAPNTVIEESDSKALQFRRVDGCSTVHVRIRNSPVGLSGSRRFHFALIATRATSERVW